MEKGVDYTGITVVFCCHDGNGRFIMAKRSNKSRDEAGLWDIGAGGLRFDEDVEQALHREIKEEYCTDVIGFSYLGFRDVHRVNFGRNTHWIALDFLVQVNPLQVAIGEPDKLIKLGWFTLKDKPKPQDSHSQLPVFWGNYSDILRSEIRMSPEQKTINL